MWSSRTNSDTLRTKTEKYLCFQGVIVSNVDARMGVYEISDTVRSVSSQCLRFQVRSLSVSVERLKIDDLLGFSPNSRLYLTYVPADHNFYHLRVGTEVAIFNLNYKESSEVRK